MKSLKKIALVFSCMALLGAGSAFAADAAQSSPLDEVQAKPGEYSFCIGYGYDYEEAVGFREMLKDLIRERLGIEEIGIYQIGATIGVHTGPYPIGIGIVRHAEV